MTDLNQTIVAPPPGEANSPAAAQEAAEKLLPQSKVNEIAGVKHQEGYEKGRRDALAEMQLKASTQQPIQQPQDVLQSPQQQVPVMPQMAQQTQMMQQQVGQPMQGQQIPMQQSSPMQTPEDIQRMVQQQIAQQQQSSLWQNTVNQFVQKISQGSIKYPDFEKVVAPLQLDQPQNQHLVQLTNMVDNTADVLHDLGNNGSKVAILSHLAMTNPQMAIKEIQALSNSIKANQAATQMATPNAPLGQLNPSTVTTDNGAPLTPSEWGKKSYLRG